MVIRQWQSDEYTATRVSRRVLKSLKESGKEDFSQSETVGFAEEALEQADRAEPRLGTRAKTVPQFLEKSGPILLSLKVIMWNPKQYRAMQGDDWD